VELDAIGMGLPLREAADLARTIEGAGFATFWFTEGGRTAYLGCTATALSTTRLATGTAVAVAFPRSPTVTAAVAWELAEATGGRFTLGLGTQVKAHITRRYGVEFEHPGPRLREYVLALRALFRAFQGEERLDFHGEFFDLDLLPAMWSPGPIEHPDVPIFLSGVRPWMLRAAGEVAAGLHVHPLHSRRYLDEVIAPNLAAGLERSGRSVAELTLACPVYTIVGDDDEERDRWRQAARLQLAFYGSTRTYREVFEVHGWPGTSERLHELQKAGDVQAMGETITDEMLAVFAVESTWDDLAGALAARYAGVEHPVRILAYNAATSIRHDGTAERWAAVARDLASAGPPPTS